MKKIFIPTYGGGHVNLIIPVARELKKLDIEVTILGLTIANLALEKANIEYKKLQDYLFLYSDEEVEKIKDIGYNLAKDNHKSENLSFEDTAYYYGIGLYSLILEKGESEALRLFEKYDRKAFSPNDFMRRLLLYEKPDGVTSTCNVRYEKAAIEEAKILNIKTYLFCDFIDEEYGGVKNFDYIFCINENQRKFFINRGIDKERLYVVGQPAFDALFNIDIKRETLEKELNIKLLDKVILWICSEYPSVEGMLQIYEDIELVAKEMSDCTFIIKLHPCSNIDYFHTTSNIYIVKNYDIQKLIFNSNLVIGTISTSVHESIILKKPIIMPNYLDEDYGVAAHYYESGSVMLLTQKGSLLSAIKKLMLSKDARNELLLNQKIYQVEPNSARSVASIIVGQRSIKKCQKY